MPSLPQPQSTYVGMHELVNMILLVPPSFRSKCGFRTGEQSRRKIRRKKKSRYPPPPLPPPCLTIPPLRGSCSSSSSLPRSLRRRRSRAAAMAIRFPGRRPFPSTRRGPMTLKALLPVGACRRRFRGFRRCNPVWCTHRVPPHSSALVHRR